MMMVIKNYQQPAGVSQRVFEPNGQNFEVKGPMGKSLNV